MRHLPLIILFCLPVNCKANEKSAGFPPAGNSLPSLPIADFSRKLTGEDTGYIEVVVSGDGHEVFQHGEKITGIRRADGQKNVGTPLLVSAPAATPFVNLMEHLRTASGTGISKILFLVREGDQPGTKVVTTDLPSMEDITIEPYFLHVSAEDRVSSRSGADQTPMDTDSKDRQLGMLSLQLELYSAAAAGSGTKPIGQVYVDPRASYQRVIDLVSLANRHGIRLFFTNTKAEPQPKPLELPIRKPTAPGQIPEPERNGD